MEEKLSESENRFSELDTLVSKLYEDWVAGRINEANFTRMMEKHNPDGTGDAGLAMLEKKRSL